MTEIPPTERPAGNNTGVLTRALEDEAGSLTGDKQESLIYQIQLDNGDHVDVRHRAIRPPIE